MGDRLRWTLRAKRAAKISGVAVVLAVLWALVPSGFLGRPHGIMPDTMTYTNAPSVHANFFGAPGFVTDRNPGMGLFLYIVTLGDIPRPDVIRFFTCDPSPGSSESCDAVMAKLPADTVTVRGGPRVYVFSKQTDMLLSRAVTAARLLMLVSFGLLLAVLARRLGWLLAAFCVAVVLHSYLNQHTLVFQDVLATEILFPAVLFLYIAAMLEYIAARRAAWLYVATVWAIFAFFVRPAFIYIPILHSAAVLLIAVRSRNLHVAGSIALVGITFAWFVLWSPSQFFIYANQWSNQLRTAVISDQSTVDCVSNPESKLILSAYLHSVANDTRFPVDPAKPENYFRRYYDLAGSWKINLSWHPIYREPGIGALVDPGTSVLPNNAIRSMLAAAQKCNFWRNLSYTLFNVEFMIGLQTVREAPYNTIRHYFFQSPVVFAVCAPIIVVAVIGALWRRDGWCLFLIGMPLLIYFGTVFVVALQQGAESRYSFVVEPLFVLSAAAAVAAIVKKLALFGRGRLFGGSVRGRMTVADPGFR